jgi:hypothetical protein
MLKRMLSWVYTSFDIKNFRGLRDIELQDLTNINLISGRNNSGKTAILEALLLHSAGAHAGEVAINMLTPFRTGMPPALDPSGNSGPWDSIFNNQDPSRSIILTGVIDGSSSTTELRASKPDYAPSGQSYAPVEANQTYRLSIQVYPARGQGTSHTLTASTQTITPAAPGIGNLSIQVSGINLKLEPPGNFIMPAFFSSGKVRTNQNELARRYSNLRIAGRDRDFIAALKVIEPRIRGVEVLVSNNISMLHADIGTAKPFPLPLMGEGTVTMADLITGIFEVRNGIALIDEIENGIHYSALPSLWHHVARAARQAKVQVFATTHSRECLLAAHESFRKTPREISLIRIKEGRDGNGSQSISHYDFKTLESALELDLDLR